MIESDIMTKQVKQIIVLVLVSIILPFQTGCAPLVYAISITVIKLAAQEQQRKEAILRNAEYHLKRREHLDLLAKHGIYPQQKLPKYRVQKVALVKQSASQGYNQKNNVAQVSMPDRLIIYETKVALQDTNRKLHNICDKALETRQNLLSANYGGREEQLTNESNGGNKNVNK